MKRISLEYRYLLPGSGRKPINCIDALPVGFCPSCGHIKLVSGNCHSPHCPDCSTAWRYTRTKKIFERLFSYKITKKTRVIHAVVSLPHEEIDQIRNIDDINEIRSIVYRWCENKGFDGGLVIFHPFRLLKEAKEELQDISMGLDNWAPGEFGLWKTLVKLENWRDYVYYSPHFHIIGCASYLQPGNKEDGWVFKRIGDLKQPLDIIRCSMYLLSHAGISDKDHTKNVFWFGGLSTVNWSLKRAPPLVQEYTRNKLKELLNAFAMDEGVNYDVCPHCLTDYIPMDLAPHYFNVFDSDINSILKVCYRWYSGDIPPPGEEFISKIKTSYNP